MFSARCVRDRVPIGRGRDGKVIVLALFAHGPAEQRQSVSAGAIAKVWGLREIHIGERIGVAGTGTSANEFPPPTLESVVDAVAPDDHVALHVALAQHAE
jgi:ribosomal protection tetracycline resistance protein